MNLYVIRHGQTDWNIQSILQGSSDIPINNVGISQANQLSKLLEDINFDYVFCSPLSRTIQTAKIATNNKEVPFILDNSLKERYYGELEGTHPDNIYKFWNYFDNTDEFGVEPIQNFIKRIFTFMDNLKNNYSAENVLISTHSGVMVGIDCYINGFKKDYDLINYKFDTGTYTKYII